MSLPPEFYDREPYNRQRSVEEFPGMQEMLRNSIEQQANAMSKPDWATGILGGYGKAANTYDYSGQQQQANTFPAWNMPERTAPEDPMRAQSEILEGEYIEPAKEEWKLERELLKLTPGKS